MDVKNFVGLLVFGVVGIIIISAFVPIIAETTDATDDFTNTGLWRMKEIEDGDIWTFTGASSEWTLNDEVLSVVPQGQNAILGNTWFCRSNGQFRATDGSGNLYNTITATVEGDTITFVGQGTQGNGAQSLPGFGADDSGDFILTKYGEMNAFVNGDTVIYGTGTSSIANTLDVICHVTATVDGGATFELYTPRNGIAFSDVEFTNTKVNYTAVNGFEDLYQVTSITTDVSLIAVIDEVDTPVSGSITYSSVVVPYEVTAEKSVHPDEALSAVIDLLPLIAGIGLLIILVAEFLYSRYL